MEIPLIVVPIGPEYYYKIQIGNKYEVLDSLDKVIAYLKDGRYGKVILGKIGTKPLSEKLSQNKIEHFYN